MLAPLKQQRLEFMWSLSPYVALASSAVFVWKVFISAIVESSFSSAQWERGLHDDKAESSHKQKQIRVSLPLSQTIAFYKWTLWATSFFRQREGNCCFMGALQHEAPQEKKKPLIVSREANVFSILFAAVCLSSVFSKAECGEVTLAAGRRLCWGPAVVSPTEPNSGWTGTWHDAGSGRPKLTCRYSELTGIVDGKE